eukprot:scaffold274646_cov21-Prasinocladus_malaysianus.AAC.2
MFSGKPLTQMKLSTSSLYSNIFRSKAIEASGQLDLDAACKSEYITPRRSKPVKYRHGAISEIKLPTTYEYPCKTRRLGFMIVRSCYFEELSTVTSRE